MRRVEELRRSLSHRKARVIWIADESVKSPVYSATTQLDSKRVVIVNMQVFSASIRRNSSRRHARNTAFTESLHNEDVRTYVLVLKQEMDRIPRLDMSRLE